MERWPGREDPGCTLWIVLLQDRDPTHQLVAGEIGAARLFLEHEPSRTPAFLQHREDERRAITEHLKRTIKCPLTDERLPCLLAPPDWHPYPPLFDCHPATTALITLYV